MALVISFVKVFSHIAKFMRLFSNNTFFLKKQKCNLEALLIIKIQFSTNRGKDNNAEEEEAKDFSQQLSISLVICLSLLPWERHSILKGQLRLLPHHS